VLIGAWPNIHCQVTLAAIGAGKHVLTQARTAMNAREAQRMLDSSLEHPELTMIVVPSP
jgi:predicted dehydrogenase